MGKCRVSIDLNLTVIILPRSLISGIRFDRKLFRLKYSIDKLADDEEEDFTGTEQEILERSLNKGSKSNGAIKTDGHNGQGSTAATENGSNDTSFIVDHDTIMSFDQLEQMAKYLGKKLTVNKQGRRYNCCYTRLGQLLILSRA